MNITHMTQPAPNTIPPDHTPPYNRDAIFHEDGPFNPSFIDEALRTLMRALPLDPAEPRGSSYRRMHSAMTALSALHARDEIEVMLGVQALSAYHAASACWRIGMNLRQPNGDSTRHITTAASAARTFDSMLRALERRQVKPLAVPVGRPAPRAWPEPTPVSDGLKLEERCRRGETDPKAPNAAEPQIVWTPQDIAAADVFIERERVEKENEGLDIANTEGILPGGGMILPESPTPQQKAYMGRRLALMYKREYEESLRKGIKQYPKIRGIRPGDLIP
jgi:hypothetical protein